MMEIKVTLEIPGLPEAVNNLANAISGKSIPAIANTVTQEKVESPTNSTPVQQAAPTSQNEIAAAGSAITQPATVANVPPVQNVQSSPAPTSFHSEPKTYTLEELSNAGAALCEQGKMPQLIELLAQFGAQSIVQVSKEHYPALADSLKTLGAAL